MENEHPSMLVLIVDCNPRSWSLKSELLKPSSDNKSIINSNSNIIQLDEMIRSIIFFTSSYCLLHRYNQLVIIANHPNGPRILYPRRNDNSNDNLNNDTFIPVMHILPTIITEGILSSCRDIESLVADNIKKSALSQCLSLSLCIISKQLKKISKLQPRILICQATKDDSTTYNAVMNSIFSAQRHRVLVDAIILSKEISHFLQQACLITNGIYQHPPDQRQFLSLLLSHYLPSASTRSLLETPIQKSVDFKASCFCHQKTVEFAYMCSVCLTLTCEEADTCSVCGIKATTTPSSSSSSSS